jgi:hypothetical protein
MRLAIDVWPHFWPSQYWRRRSTGYATRNIALHGHRYAL